MPSTFPVALREKLGETATFGLKEVLDAERHEWSEQVLSRATDRFERRLAEEVGALRTEMHAGFADIRQELATTRVEMLKWSFLFWIGQVATIAALLSFMLRGVKP